MKLSDWVFAYVASLGVKHVFEVTGGGAMHLNDSLGQCADIEYVCTLHEQAAAMAAESYAKVRNDIGVCLVTAGPGGTNALTGVAGAFLDSTPMLVISGQVKRADRGRVQEGDHLSDRLLRHHFLAIGAGVDVAVEASLVALVAEVHLQRLQRLATKMRETA